MLDIDKYCNKKNLPRTTSLCDEKNSLTINTYHSSIQQSYLNHKHSRSSISPMVISYKWNVIFYIDSEIYMFYKIGSILSDCKTGKNMRCKICYIF